MLCKPFSLSVRLENVVLRVDVTVSEQSIDEEIDFGSLEAYCLEMVTRPDAPTGFVQVVSAQSEAIARPRRTTCVSCGSSQLNADSNYCQACFNKREFGTVDGYN